MVLLRCQVCESPTGGIFNNAEKDLEKLKKRTKRRKISKAENDRMEAGESP